MTLHFVMVWYLLLYLKLDRGIDVVSSTNKGGLGNLLIATRVRSVAIVAIKDGLEVFAFMNEMRSK
jgi:hypothetical protein